MLGRLLEDMQVVQQQGAGYYSCIPVSRRYNKLLSQARQVVGKDDSLIGTFEPLPETDPKDPGDKMKMMQGFRVEIGQLITLLQALEGTDSEAEA